MTALLVERDAARVLVIRHLRGACTAEEWAHPAWRRAAIDRCWALAAERIRRQGDYVFVSPMPVTLWCRPTDGAVVYADAGDPKRGSRWLWPDGEDILVAPDTTGLVVRLTTYREWAEGPLDHLEILDERPIPLPAEIERYRAQNTALRERIDRAIGIQRGPEARSPDASLGLVDFRLRGIFERPELRVLQSRQTGDDAKLIRHDGSVVDVISEES